MLRDHPFRLVILTALTLVAFASNSLLARAALLPGADGGIDATSFTLIRIAAGASTLYLLVAARRRKLFGPIFGCWAGGLWLGTYAVAFSFAYLMLDAGFGALLLFGAVQVTMIGHGVARGERPTAWAWVGAIAAFSGLIVLVRPGLEAPPIVGAVLMVLAGAAWGSYSIIGRGDATPVETTAGNFIRALPIVMLAGLPWYASLNVSVTGVALAVISGAITSGLGYVLWYSVLPSLSATLASVLQLTVPLLAAGGGVLLLDEQLTLRFGIAAALILGGVGLTLLRHRTESVST
jgi:drug/metabolite transporter (DMT)-like permease